MSPFLHFLIPKIGIFVVLPKQVGYEWPAYNQGTKSLAFPQMSQKIVAMMAPTHHEFAPAVLAGASSMAIIPANLICLLVVVVVVLSLGGVFACGFGGPFLRGVKNAMFSLYLHFLCAMKALESGTTTDATELVSLESRVKADVGLNADPKGDELSFVVCGSDETFVSREKSAELNLSEICLVSADPAGEITLSSLPFGLSPCEPSLGERGIGEDQRDEKEVEEPVDVPTEEVAAPSVKLEMVDAAIPPSNSRVIDEAVVTTTTADVDECLAQGSTSPLPDAQSVPGSSPDNLTQSAAALPIPAVEAESAASSSQQTKRTRGKRGGKKVRDRQERVRAQYADADPGLLKYKLRAVEVGIEQARREMGMASDQGEPN
ncbi:hypothetical protein UCRPC4_g06266 [Phaeomoniella chlamydospora]|uniref:Uncharacterized protein n=1 Tax=Phaeomoniella chlamydospora TaxID=158046 RepID=A0A0G2DY86_PHACM|nr:hypothetical protein UCRPC4_g06266 [Phaeomoniella chlamydospora]